MLSQKFQTKIGNREMEVEIGGFAEQASGSCLIKWGQTSLLCTAQLGEEKEGIDFFPLSCEYEERYYAAGKIGGSRFIRREGRPTPEAVVVARMIDRTLRPLFPSALKREVQTIATCLSWDEQNDPAVLGILGTSLALLISEIPWEGPVGAVRVGKIGEKFLINPTYEEREEGEMDIVLSGIEKEGKILINMIEGEAKEVSEETIKKAYQIAAPFIKKSIEFQKEIAQKIGKEKIKVFPEKISPSLEKKVKDILGSKLESALYQQDKLQRQKAVREIWEEIEEEIKKEFGEEKVSQGKMILAKETERLFKHNILKEERRPDGRKLDEIRPLEIKVGLLPRTHGSGFFARGLTKVLSILTLGSPGDQLLLEGMEVSGSKRFLHHYNFPPYCAGEVKKLGPPSRREIGHGMLAERALKWVIPDFDQFPYTIRIVSEVLSSNGSTSMASVSAACLALMDAGVPIKKPVAGIAIGMVKKSDKEWKLLTDIQGPEDHYGDMDFKVAGTEEGITALQMDVKTDGIGEEILEESLERARKARLEILERIKKVISAPRSHLSPFAPRVFTLEINPDKIGLVIGPGGATIKQIIEKYNVTVDIEENGKIFVSGEEEKKVKEAVKKIKQITKDIEIGDVFQGKVKKILDFGVIVEIAPGREGLCHISELAPQRIKKIRDVIKVGQILPVKVIHIDELGRVNLSAKQAGFSLSNLPQHKNKRFYAPRR